MRVLAVASEMFPIVKTGGLADVAGALPEALAGHGVETVTLLPGYPSVLAALAGRETLASHADLFGGPAALLGGTGHGRRLLVLDAPHLYARPGSPYLGPDGKDWPDNWQRFAALARIAAGIGRGSVAGFAPDVVHAHDWQAALAGAYLRYGSEPGPPSVLTIHNLAFQGNFAGSIFPALGLPDRAFSIDGVEYYGGVSFLKGGLATADALTTVSPTYAEEIKTAEGGMGLDGLLRSRAAALHGIVNGIDTSVWNPAADPLLPHPYRATSLPRRRANKRLVEQRFGLTAGDGLLISIICRLTWQKGIDLVIETAADLVALGARLAILGAGDAALEAAVSDLVARHPGRIASIKALDEGAAHLVQGGSDAILIPSRFEPCGLTQQCALRYGAVPIVSRVGGHVDTVIDANEAALAAGVANGIMFSPVNAGGLRHALRRAAALYADEAAWRRLQRRAMASDVSWTRSAASYAALYARVKAEPRPLA